MTRAGFLCALFGLMLLISGSAAEARQHRSQAVLHAFQKANPCPSTGKKSGACPGYVKDHVKPLACGGADAVENLQWQTQAAGKAKDRVELQGCGR